MKRGWSGRKKIQKDKDFKNIFIFGLLAILVAAISFAFFFSSPNFLSVLNFNTITSYDVFSSYDRFFEGVSIALDSSGKIHIAYPEKEDSSGNYFLKYCKEQSDGDFRCVVIDNPNANVGQYSSIAVGSDYLARISYYDATNNNLKHCKEQSDGSFACTVIDSTGDVGQYSSIAIDSYGESRISYYDGASNKNLKYCTNFDDIWDCTATIDSTGDVGQYSSIAINSSNRVRISYYDAINKDLKHCEQVKGKSFRCSIIDSTGDVGQYSSIAIPSDNRAIVSYYNASTQDLSYCRQQTDGTFKCFLIDSTGDVGQYSSIAINSTNGAHISYYDATNGDLKYCFSKSSGSLPNICRMIDSTGDVGQYSSIEISNDKAVISYFDNTDKKLKYCKEQSDGSFVCNIMLIPGIEEYINFNLDSSSASYGSDKILNANSDTGIDEINLDVASASAGKIYIGSYSDNPKPAVSGPATVYKYIRIVSDKPDDIKKAVLKLKIKKSWTSSNSLVSGDISLFKYKEPSNGNTGTWLELRTVYDSATTDSSAYYYNIPVNSFGIFAIAKKTGNFNSSLYLPVVAFDDRQDASSKNKTFGTGAYIDTIEIKAKADAVTDDFYGNIDTVTISLYNSTGAKISSDLGIFGRDSSSKIFSNLNSAPYYIYHLNATVNNTYGDTGKTETRIIVLQNPIATPTQYLSLSIKPDSRSSVKTLTNPINDASIPSYNLSVRKIILDVKNSVAGQSLNFNAYGERPVVFSSDDFSQVYQHLKISSTLDLSGNLDHADLEFRVSKAWLQSKSLNTDEISLFYYNPAISNWTRLETSHGGNDTSNNAYSSYSVRLDSFGYFTIAEKNLLSELRNNLLNAHFGVLTTGAGNYIDKNEIIIEAIGDKDVKPINSIVVSLYNSTGLVNTASSTSDRVYANFSNLSSGTYYYEAKVTDTAGNILTTGRNRVILQLSEIKKSYTIAKIDDGKSSNYSFDANSGVKRLEITADSDIVNAQVTIRSFGDDVPVTISEEKSGEVYKYFQIDTVNVNDDLDFATIEIGVEKGWLDDNDFGKENISLFQYDEDDEEWDDLDVVYKSEDTGKYYYTAEVDSFSYFAIAEKNYVSPVVVTNPPPGNQSTPTPPSNDYGNGNDYGDGTDLDNPELDGPTEESLGVFSQHKGLIIFLSIAAVFLLVTLLFLFRILSKRKLEKFEQGVISSERKVVREVERDLHFK